ncbi:MAG TPA: three-Cys-motif partner protein TcmP [Thermoleophilaceae bacterium]|nr:three-Cys-motif partner protein TcmP [Thermoleophilaceae bacterium]
MPTNPERFFADPKESSRYKVELLGDYALPFFYKLGSRYPRVWIVDGYAGPASYEPEPGSSPTQIGSPMATARVARQVVSEQHRSELRIINVERDRDIYARLQSNLKGFAPQVINFQGSFDSRVEDILQIVGNDPVLFFVDPFGMEGADLRLVDRLLDRKARTITELLINFSYRGFQRMAGNLISRPRSPARQKAADTKIAKLDAILGTRQWRWVWNDKSLTPTEKCARVADLYRDSLRERGIEYVHPIQMRDDYYGPVRYELIFATRSSHGVYLMSNFVASYQEKLFDATHSDLSFEPQLRIQEHAVRRDGLRAEIHALGLELRKVSPEQIMRHLAPRHWGTFKEKDYMSCIRDLVRGGGIQRDSATGITKREELRFIPFREQDLFSIPVGGRTSDLAEASNVTHLNAQDAAQAGTS